VQIRKEHAGSLRPEVKLLERRLSGGSAGVASGPVESITGAFTTEARRKKTERWRDGETRRRNQETGLKITSPSP
jgi:hypothetical protein